MSNKIVTFYNCKIGDKVIYTEPFLKNHSPHLHYIVKNNVVYLIIIKVYENSITTNWVDYKGVVRMPSITSMYIEADYFGKSYMSFEFFDPENPKDFKNI